MESISLQLTPVFVASAFANLNPGTVYIRSCYFMSCHIFSMTGLFFIHEAQGTWVCGESWPAMKDL